MKPVKNSVSRIWTRTELRETKKEASAVGYQVTETDGLTEILDPEKDEIVLRSMNTGRTELVRLNTFYFEPINN
jgi:hypothetical protein